MNKKIIFLFFIVAACTQAMNDQLEVKSQKCTIETRCKQDKDVSEVEPFNNEDYSRLSSIRIIAPQIATGFTVKKLANGSYKVHKIEPNNES